MPHPAPPGADTASRRDDLGLLPPWSLERRAAPSPGRDSARGQDFMDALVPDAHLNAAVAGIRGLGGAGLRVMAVGPGWTAAGLWSKHTAARAVAPSVVDDPGGYAERLAHSRRGHRPAGGLPQQGGDHRRDARRPRCLGRRDPALPGRRRCWNACGTRRRLVQTARAGGNRNARVAVLRAGPRAAGAAVPRSGGREAGAAGQQSEDGAPRARRRRSSRTCWTACPTTSRCWSRSGCAARSCRSSWCSTATGSLVARFQQRRGARGRRAGRLDRARDQRRARRGAGLAAPRRCSEGWAIGDSRRSTSWTRIRGTRCWTSTRASTAACRSRSPAEPTSPPSGTPSRSGAPSGRPHRYRTGVTYRWLEADFVAAVRGAPRRLLERVHRALAPAQHGPRMTRCPDCC